MSQDRQMESNVGEESEEVPVNSGSTDADSSDDGEQLFACLSLSLVFHIWIYLVSLHFHVIDIPLDAPVLIDTDDESSSDISSDESAPEDLEFDNDALPGLRYNNVECPLVVLYLKKLIKYLGFSSFGQIQSLPNSFDSI